MLSVHASQAFDRMEWKQLFDLLPRYSLGETFLKLIKLLYTNPTAEILTNNTISRPFSLQHSTRQGFSGYRINKCKYCIVISK